MMHGYGSNERDLPSLAPFLPAEMPWVSLRAPISMGYGGYAWFHLPDGDWLRKGPIEDATAQVWEWIDTNVRADAPIAALGFSQGGLMASQLLRTRPDRVKDTVILAGFVLETSQPGDAALAETRPPVFWGRGAADAVIPAEHIASAQEFLSTHTTLKERVYPGLAHSITAEEMAHAREYLLRD